MMALSRPNARMELLFQKGKEGPDFVICLGINYRVKGEKAS